MSEQSAVAVRQRAEYSKRTRLLCAVVLDPEAAVEIEGSSGPTAVGIRCPKCKWAPRTHPVPKDIKGPVLELKP